FFGTFVLWEGFWVLRRCEVQCGDSVLRGWSESNTRGSCEAGEKRRCYWKVVTMISQVPESELSKLRTGGSTVLKTAMAAATALRPRGEPLPRSLQARPSQRHPWVSRP